MLMIGLTPSGHVVGRQAIVVHEVILPLSRLFNDDENIVRNNAHRAIEMISESNIGVCVCVCLSVCLSVCLCV